MCDNKKHNQINPETAFICQNFVIPAKWDISVNKILNINNLRESKVLKLIVNCHCQQTRKTQKSLHNLNLYICITQKEEINTYLK